MTQETAAKRDTQKLQRAIVDGLEDVKAQDIQVFNTEHLSPLFERVIVASGTSNRQTKALAASVVDAVREAGFPKPRVEGEDNGEWIIVDCGAAVAHIMQPAIRTYYHLEEIWGEKPVRLRLGAPKPVAPAAAAQKQGATASSGKADKAGGGSLRRSSAAKTATRAAEKAARDEALAGGGRGAGGRARPAAGKSAAGRSTAGKSASGRAAPAKARAGGAGATARAAGSGQSKAKASLPKLTVGASSGKKADTARKKSPAKSASAKTAPARNAPVKSASRKAG